MTVEVLVDLFAAETDPFGVEEDESLLILLQPRSENLTEISKLNPTNGQFLVHNSTELTARSLSSADLAAIPVQALSNVTVSGVSVGQVLKWNGIQWTNANDSPTPAALESLSNVTLSSPLNGQVLKFNGAAWVNGADTGPAINLNAITDVTVATPSNGQVLKYNGSQWINDTDNSSGGVIQDLSNVTITTPAAGQVLKYDGTEWVNDDDEIGSTVDALDDLSDVNLGTPQAGDLLRYDGTDWVPYATNPTLVSELFWDATDILNPNQPTGTIHLQVAGAADTALTRSTSPTLGRIGVVQANTGGNGGAIAIGHGTDATAQGNAFHGGTGTLTFSTSIYIDSDTQSLSKPAQRYQLFAGFMDEYIGLNKTDGIYFLYDEAGVSIGAAVSTNWQIVATSNNVRTFANTSTVVALDTWYNLRVEVNAAGTLAEFFINGTSVGTITTNLPTGLTRGFGASVGARKSSGTDSFAFLCDWLYWQQTLTLARGNW